MTTAAETRGAAQTARRQQRTQMLLTAPIVPTLAKLAAPNVAAMFFTAIMSISEGYFAGQLGVSALAGLALVFPFVMLMQMLSAGAFGGAISSAVARALGAGDAERAEGLLRHVAVIAVIMPATMALLMGIFGRTVFSALGGEGAALDAALAYAAVYFPGCVMLWFTNCMLSFIRGAGDMAGSSFIMALSALLAAPIGGALSQGWGPLPALGMAGLGAGPVGGFGIGAILAVLYIASGRVGLSARGFVGAFKRSLFWDILNVGLVGSLSAFQTVLPILAMVGLVGQFGEAAIAGYGLGARLEFLVIPIAFGIGVAMTAMVGANIGAGQRERALRVGWMGSLTAGALVGMFGIVAKFFPDLWLGLFLKPEDTDALAAGRAYFAIVGPFFGCFAFGLAFYFASQGASRVGWPVIPGFARLLSAAIGGYVATRVLGFGVEGVFWSVAFGMFLLGLINAVSVHFTRWR